MTFLGGIIVGVAGTVGAMWAISDRLVKQILTEAAE